MIEFSRPGLVHCLADKMEIVRVQEESGSCVGYCVSLGEKFFLSGADEIDKYILPEFSQAVGDTVTPRVLPAYSILYWFGLEVCN